MVWGVATPYRAMVETPYVQHVVSHTMQGQSQLTTAALPICKWVGSGEPTHLKAGVGFRVDISEMRRCVPKILFLCMQSPNECLRVFVLAVNELKSCFDVTSLTTSIVDSLPHDHVYG